MFENLKDFMNLFSKSGYTNPRANEWPRNYDALVKTATLVDNAYKFLAAEASRFKFYGLPSDLERLNYCANDFETQKEFYENAFKRLLQSGRVLFLWRYGIFLDEYQVSFENGTIKYTTDKGTFLEKDVIDIKNYRFSLENISKELFEKLRELETKQLNSKPPKYSLALETRLKPEDLQDLLDTMLVADKNGVIVADNKIKDLKILDQVNLAEQKNIEIIEKKVYDFFAVTPELLNNSSSKEALDNFRYNVIEDLIELLEQHFKLKINKDIELFLSYQTRMTDEKLKAHGQFGTITVNESRHSIGLPDRPDGDILIENWNSKKGANETAKD